MYGRIDKSIIQTLADDGEKCEVFSEGWANELFKLSDIAKSQTQAVMWP